MLENKIRKFVLRKGLLLRSPFLFIDGVLLLAVLVYLISRAVVIPITHDEAGTILNFASSSYWDIVSYKEPIPNNHLLNTLLIKVLLAFGSKEWLLRLPNLCAACVYLYYAFKISRALFNDDYVRTGLLLLLVANPYLLEFFALARGYGLSVGCMMASVYFTLRWQAGEGTSLKWALSWACTAAYANITVLNFLLPLYAWVVIMAWSFKRHEKSSIVKGVVISGMMALVLLAWPIYKMIITDQFSYWGFNGFVTETINPSIKSALQGEAYFGMETEKIFRWMVMTGIIILAVITGLRLLKNKKHYMSSPSFLLFYLFIGTLVYNLVQRWVLHIPYLNARTSLFFYPLMILAVGAIMNLEARPHGQLILKAVFIGSSLFGLWHITRTYNLHSSYEWWFDGDNKKVLSLIKVDSSENKSATFACHWLFQPSMRFYLELQNRANLPVPAYSKHIDTVKVYDYYYLTAEDKNEWIDKNYDIKASYGWNSRYLMKKKQTR